MALDLSLNRDEERRFINVLKGFSALTVLWGHVIQVLHTGSQVDFWEDPVFKFIYSFHMPLFMLISGYLFSFSFKKRELKELIVYRCKPLLLTIVVFGFIKYYLVNAPLAIFHSEISLLFNGEWISNLTNEYWFLWSVIICSVIVSVAFKKTERFPLQIVLLGVVSVLILIMPFFELTVFMLPYFVLGFLFANYRDKIPEILMKLKYASLLAFPVMLMFFEKKHYIYTTGLIRSEYSIKECLFIDAFRWAIGLVGSVFIITLLFMVFKLKPLQKLYNCFEKLGGYTLQIYVYQMIFLLRLGEMGINLVFKVLGTSNVIPEKMLLLHIVIVPVLTVVATIVFYFISKYLNKFKFIQAVFGR